jgi:hypothetical protein
VPIANVEISREKGCCQLANVEVAAAVGAVEIRDHGEHIQIGPAEQWAVTDRYTSKGMR